MRISQFAFEALLAHQPHSVERFPIHTLILDLIILYALMLRSVFESSRSPQKHHFVANKFINTAKIIVAYFMGMSKWCVCVFCVRLYCEHEMRSNFEEFSALDLLSARVNILWTIPIDNFKVVQDLQNCQANANK